MVNRKGGAMTVMVHAYVPKKMANALKRCEDPTFNGRGKSQLLRSILHEYLKAKGIDWTREKE